MRLAAPELGYHSSMLATSTSSTGGALYWIVDQVMRHGPSWSLVPPLMFGEASLVGAVLSWRKMGQDLAIARAKADQELRQSEEFHKARIYSVQTYGVDPALPKPPLPFVPEVKSCQ